jgi:hypothetical protein
MDAIRTDGETWMQDGISVTTCAPEGERRTIAVTYPDTRVSSAESLRKMKARARLFAAAPELLAALTTAHDILRADDRYGALAYLPAGGIECEEMVQRAVDVLASALSKASQP